jgi:hypothetical protein
MNATLGKLLRVAAILLMGMTVAMTLLGAVGSTCAALKPENFDSMLPLAPYKWLYQLLVVVSLAAGVWGIRALVELVRGSPKAYRDTLIVLLVGGGAALVQVMASRYLRGKSMPTDVRLWITVFTLAVFLLLRLPGVREAVDFGRGGRGASRMAGGMAAIVFGALALTVHLWAGPTHTWGGVNYADVWRISMTVIGWGLALGGAGLMAADMMPKGRQLPTPRVIESLLRGHSA